MKFNKEIFIGDKVISTSSATFVIAEAGVNHGGDMAVAKKLIDLASESGADAVKFQTFSADDLILDNVEKAPYQKKTTAVSESQMDMLRKLEVTKEQNVELKSYSQEKGIIFLTTPFDENSLEQIDSLDLLAYKVASTDTTNLPFLKKIAKKGKPIFLSTGMTYLSEIELALRTIYKFNQNVVLLQCTANYPIRDEEANLKVIDTFKENFDVLVGYSDHSVGVGAAPFAIPMGAKVVEKHFTLDKSLEGPDHEASLSPEELKDFVSLVRRVDSYMGTAVKTPNLSETRTRASLQKCLVAACDIKQGDLFTEENIVAKRTGGIGISPIYSIDILGQIATRDFNTNDIIEII
ncbi:N-acetylneuraminate synthase [Vibrio sp. OCN044]|uniref:N-acetylneuraminate synthase n=1 Tax=Vibrio tetraodonis subsp. pristinus TaxID=2695891 RepID=A0A6L8LZ48_9VIBR|nr:N-acetylneuraminate synthase family protein [Vibrio tetraodonis]MYM60763.1 N-acetylneuraminate synthase [Vibrio tetraodonis subsp. pristinus]